MKLLVAVVASVALAACSGGGGEHAGGHDAAEEAVATVPGAPTVTVAAVDIDFTPARLELAAGEPLNVTVSNDGATLHDFTLEAAGVHLNLEPGETKSAALTITEPGRYTAECTVPGHADAGMTVEVVVT